MRLKGSLLYLAFLAPLLLCAACGGSSKHVTGVALSATSASVPAGRTTQVTVTVTYSNGTTVTNPAGIAFTSSDSTIATVSANGLVTTRKPGTATISATYVGKSGTTIVTATAAVIDSFSLSHTNISLAKGYTKAITLTGVMSDGSAAVASNLASCAWTSPAGVATLSGSTGSSNILTAAGIGSGALSVTCGGITQSTTVTVTTAVIDSFSLSHSNISLAKGYSKAITLSGIMSDGSAVVASNFASCLWTAPSGVATLSGSSGSSNTLTAAGVGSGALSVTCGGITQSTNVTVTAAVIDSFSLSHTNISLAKGYTKAITLNGTMSDGSATAAASFAGCAWTAPAGVATLSGNAGSSNTLTAAGVGSGALSVTCDGITQSTSVTVTAPVIDSFSLSHINISLPKGLTRTITLSGTMSDGVAVEASNFAGCAWTSPGDFAPLSGITGISNTLTAAGVGSGTLSITCSGITQSTNVTITAAEITRIDLAIPNSTIDVDTTAQFTATATLTDNTTKNVTSTAAWTSGTTTVATVDTATAGLVRGVAAGSTTITATENGVSGTFLLTVANAASNAASFVYATSYNYDDQGWLLTTYDVSEDGTFTNRGSKPFDSNSGRMALAGTRFLFLDPYSSQGPNDPVPGNQIKGYSIDQTTGNLSPLPTFTPSGTQVDSLSIDPTGHWMIAFDLSDISIPKMRVFAIDQETGALSDTGLAYSLPDRKHPSSNNVTGFMRNEVGTFFYFGQAGALDCSNYGGSGPCYALFAYSLDSETGGMSVLPGSPYQSSARSPQTFALAINGSGSVLWLSLDAYRIASFRLNSTTGVPSEFNYWWPNGSGLPIGSMAVHDSYFYAGQGYKLLWIKPDPETQALGSSVWTYVNDPDNTEESRPLYIRSLALDEAYHHLFVGDEGGISTFNLDDTGQPSASKRITTPTQVEQMIVIPRI